MTSLESKDIIPEWLYEAITTTYTKENNEIIRVFKSWEEIADIEHYSDLLTNTKILQSKIDDYTNQLLHTINNENSKPALGKNKELVLFQQPLEIAKKIIKEENLYPSKSLDELRNDKDAVLTIKNMLENKNIILMEEINSKMLSITQWTDLEVIHDIATEQQDLLLKHQENTSSIWSLTTVIAVLNNYIRARTK